MTLLDMVTEDEDKKISGSWDYNHQALRLLNTESKGNCFFVSVAIDLVLQGIRDPGFVQIRLLFIVDRSSNRFLD